MAVSFPSTANDVTTANAALAGTITGNKPANTANGDLLIAYVYYRNSASTVTVPSGWTAVPGTTNPTNETFSAYYKPVPTASAETATSYTWSFTGGSARCEVTIHRVVGANLSNPIDASGQLAAFTGTASMVFPSVTAVAAGAGLIAWGLNHNATATPSTFATPTGLTQLAQDGFTNGSTASSDTWLGCAPLTAAGATPAYTSAFTPTASNSGGFTFTVAPASSVLTASLTLAPTSGQVPFTVTATATTAGGTGTPVSYSWNWGDGATTAAGSSATATHQYTTPGTVTNGVTQPYTVQVTASNT